MKQRERRKLWLTAIMLTAFFAASAIGVSAQSEGSVAVVPMVTATNPANGTIAVDLNQAVEVTFSQPMSGPSVGVNLILQRPGGSRVSGIVSVQGATAVFTPSVDLLPDTTYTGKVKAAASDLAGVELGHPYTWKFTTGANHNTTKPTVTFTDPANAATDVVINQPINAIFSEDMDPRSLTNATFKVTKPGGAALFGTIKYTAGSVTFRPSNVLKPNTHYIATITTGAKDLAGNPLVADYVWSFDTGSSSDRVRPTVTLTNPATDAVSVLIDQKVSATFSKPMNYATITTKDFFLKWSGGRVLVACISESGIAFGYNEAL